MFGMLRNPWLGLFTVGVTLFFSGLLAAIVYADGPGFFVVVFGLATLFLAWASVDTLFGITRVRVEPGRLRVRAGLFGIGPLRTLQLHEIERIRVVPEAQYGKRVVCRIRIERRARAPGESAWRRRVTAGTRIPSLAAAETLARAMREYVGLPSPT